MAAVDFRDFINSSEYRQYKEHLIAIGRAERHTRLAMNVCVPEPNGSLPGTVVVYVFDDLDDTELRYHFKFYLDLEDYEYLTQLKYEADMRGITLNHQST